MSAYTLKGKLDEVMSSLTSIDTASLSTLTSTFENFDGTTITTQLSTIMNDTDRLPVSPAATADIANALVDIKNKDINATFNASTDSLEAISEVANNVLNTMATQTSTSTIINAMALETTASIISNKLGEFGGASVQSYLYNISLITGSPLRRGCSFSNNSGTITLYTVTGAVRLRLTAVCTTALAAAGGGTMTLKSGTNTIIAATTITDIGTGDLWYSATPTKTCEAYASACLDVVIGDGGDIIIEVETAKQIDSGVMMFYAEWLPISWDGNVSET